MIVVDASVLAPALLRTPDGFGERLFAGDTQLHAPHLIDAEVMSAFRKLVSAKALAARRAEEGLDDLLTLDLKRYPHAPLLHRAWELRHNLSPYDALYVALAETLDAPLLTRDRRLANAPGHNARIEVL